MPTSHPHLARICTQIVEHARAGREAFVEKRFVEARLHRDCCGWLIWRLRVDGVTAQGELCWDGAKYETRLEGRLSSADARTLRESPEFAKRKQSALKKRLACDHVAPRSCVADVLVQPGWWNPEDDDSARRFLMAHAEVAILTPDEDLRLKPLKADMPREWWDADLAEKAKLAPLRYKAAEVYVARWPEPVPPRSEG